MASRYINPIGLEQLNPTWKFYTIYCCWIAFELLVVYFAYIETKGPTLEEIAKLFDGDSAQTGVADIGKVKNEVELDEVDEVAKKDTSVQVEKVASKA